MPLATLLVALLTARSSKLTGKPKSPLSDAARAEREAKRKGGTVILRANRTAPPSKFGQRLTMLRADPPSLMLLYHIEKTGAPHIPHAGTLRMPAPRPSLGANRHHLLRQAARLCSDGCSAR